MKVFRYKVYHKDAPSTFVVVRTDRYSPMDIKAKAIKQSDRFGWHDYTALRLKRIREGDPEWP